MFLGMICETGPAEEVYHAPLHPYTRFLINSIPQPDPHKKQEEQSLLSGEMPGPVQPPSGCRFRTRCPYATELCAKQVPAPQKTGAREVACHYPLKD
jgi:oligopeptide/dipeptide ABC transporter ATP-binding protein